MCVIPNDYVTSHSVVILQVLAIQIMMFLVIFLLRFLATHIVLVTHIFQTWSTRAKHVPNIA